MIQTFGQIGLEKQRRSGLNILPFSQNCLEPKVVKSHCPNFRIIIAIFKQLRFLDQLPLPFDHCPCIFDLTYHKFPKYSDTQKFCCNHSKIWTRWLYHRVMSPNNADRMANSVDPDQTAPVWSGSALFAQTCLSKNLGTLRYKTVTGFKSTNCCWPNVRNLNHVASGMYVL